MSTAELTPEPRDLGRPIQGPTAFGSDPSRVWRLTWTMAVTDFKLRFFGSVFGYLWQLMRPLMLALRCRARFQVASTACRLDTKGVAPGQAVGG